MRDSLTWSPISLGRWFGTTVRVHILLIIFVVFRLLTTAVSLRADKGTATALPATACWLGLLLLALALHELGHALMASWLDCRSGGGAPLAAGEPGRSLVRCPGRASISWWPWPARSPAGPFFLVTAIGVNVFGGAQIIWNPFGKRGDAGAPRLRRR